LDAFALVATSREIYELPELCPRPEKKIDFLETMREQLAGSDGGPSQGEKRNKRGGKERDTEFPVSNKISMNRPELHRNDAKVEIKPNDMFST